MLQELLAIEVTMTSSFIEYPLAEKMLHLQLHTERSHRLLAAITTFQDASFARNALKCLESLVPADSRAAHLAPWLRTRLCGDIADQETAHLLARYIFVLKSALEKPLEVPSASQQQLKDDATVFVALQDRQLVGSRGLVASWNEVGRLDKQVRLSFLAPFDGAPLQLLIRFKSGFVIDGVTEFDVDLQHIISVELDLRAKRTRNPGSALFQLEINPNATQDIPLQLREWFALQPLSVDSADDALGFIFTLRKLRELNGHGIMTAFSSAHLKRNRNDMRNLRFILTCQYLSPLGTGLQTATVKQMEEHTVSGLKRLLAGTATVTTLSM